MNIIDQFTWRNMRKNRVRTFVTVIGIILSTAMFTAVTEGAISIRQFMVESEIAENGAWQICCLDFDEKSAEEAAGWKGISESTKIHNLGYAKLEDPRISRRPYLCVEALEENYASFVPKIKVTEGRMPENDTEIILPEQVLHSGNLSVKVGDTLTLELGERYYQGEKLGGQQYNAILDENGSVCEELKNKKKKTYTVVGICEQAAFGYPNAAGYDAFTAGDAQGILADVYLKAEDMGDCVQITEALKDKYTVRLTDQIKYHRWLLLLLGKGRDQKFTRVMYSIAGIMMAVIMIASISLIYNAFSISMSERTKMYGLLKSVGATKKQIKNSVIFEALCLCAAGIPLGIGSGLLGVGVTLKYIGGLMVRAFTDLASGEVSMHLVLSVPAVLTAALTAVLTVLLSAMIPALRAVRMPVIEALLQSNDIKNKKKQKGRKTSRLSYKVLGFEGTLARVNLKRNKKKQRTIVRSLAVSIILFLTVTTLASYLADSARGFQEKYINDIEVHLTVLDPKHAANQVQNIKKVVSVGNRLLAQAKDIKKSAYCIQVMGAAISPVEALSDEDHDTINHIRSEAKDGLIANVVSLCFIQDEIYEAYLEEQGLDADTYMDADKLTPLYDDTYHGWDEKKAAYYNGRLFGRKGFLGKVYAIQEADRENSYVYFELQKDGALQVIQEVYDPDSEEDGKKTVSPVEKAGKELSFAEPARLKGDYPLGMTFDGRGDVYIKLFLPYSALKALPDTFMTAGEVSYGFLTDDYIAADEEVGELIDEIEWDTDLKELSGNGSISVYSSNNARETASVNSIIWILRILSYGFVGLISLIIVANVFNTVSTSLSLRRQEFAMLKSVGMSQRELMKLMNVECLYYGLKGILYGIPLSVGICYLVYHVMQNEFDFQFYIPGYGLAAVTVFVFVIVFVSMLYSMGRMKGENPVETLRNDVI